MLKIEFTEAQVEQLYHPFMEHPTGLVKKKLHVIYLKSLGLPHQEIACIARISGDRVTVYLKEYDEVGLSGISALSGSHFQASGFAGGI